MSSPLSSAPAPKPRPDMQQRIDALWRRIENSVAKSGRTTTDVQLVAVSKTHPWALVQAAYVCGLRHFGENRPEALAQRLEHPRQDMPALAWHLVGPLQSRKIRLLPPNLQLVHSVDRRKTGALLSALGERHARPIPILIQVNPLQEATKQGLAPEQVPALAAELCQMPGLDVQGLMTMAPLGAEEKVLRQVFGTVREQFHRLAQALPEGNWQHLSMGMSDDFETALEEGATIVRIGTAIFGHRTG